MTVTPIETSGPPKPVDEARGRLQRMGVAEPSAALVVAEMVRDAACTMARTARANPVLGFADPDLETFDLCEAEAQRVRDALLDA